MPGAQLTTRCGSVSADTTPATQVRTRSRLRYVVVMLCLGAT